MSATVRTLVLIGPHGAGKSTLGPLVASALAWRYDDELGERLRRTTLAIRPDAHAMTPDREFDLAVSRAELARDRAHDGPRVIETWHPGNLAYAHARDPRLAAHLAPVLARATAAEACRGGVLVQPLMIGPRAARMRRTEPGPRHILDFFLKVGALATNVARGWGLVLAPPIRTDRCSIDEAVGRVLARSLGHEAAS